MIKHGEAILPAVGDVGVVAVTDDSWNGVWTTRHFMLHHLARYFRVAWLEPMEARGRILARRSQARSIQEDAQGTKSIKTAGVEGVTKCQPLRWLPDFHGSQRLRRAVRSFRYARAGSYLRKLGCSRVVLYLWRPSYVDALASRQWFDAVVYHIDDEYTFSENRVHRRHKETARHFPVAPACGAVQHMVIRIAWAAGQPLWSRGRVRGSFRGAKRACSRLP